MRPAGETAVFPHTTIYHNDNMKVKGYFGGDAVPLHLVPHPFIGGALEFMHGTECYPANTIFLEGKSQKDKIQT